MLKSYMHGYFMELRAYEKLVLSNDPFAYEKFKKDQVEKRLSKQRERIQVNKKKSGFDAEVKVNQKFVDELIAQNTSNKKKKQNTDVEALMTDDRFKVMFEDNEFKRDVNSIEYKTRPSQANHENQRDDDSDDSDLEHKMQAKKSTLNNLFSGK